MKQITLTLTRNDVLKRSKNKPLDRLTWSDLRGTMRSFSEADIVIVKDGDRTRIMKDRQGFLRGTF